jgi:small subunit ribosomal protein S1
MDTEITPPTAETPTEATTDSSESFGEMLAEFEHSHKKEAGQKQLEGTVLSLSADSVYVDIGYKVEGVLPRSAFPNNAEKVQVGDKLGVSVKGRSEGYYDLSLFRVSQPRDWTALEEAFAQKTPIVGTVTAVVKGGLSVDVGVRAFMPQSRSGARDERELNDLVGQEITCRIIKLDAADEDVVVDRRSVLEEQALAQAQSRAAGLNEGDVIEGTVRSMMPYGAFIDLGGVDGLLHVSDLSWSRVASPEDVLTVGQTVQVKLLKIDPETRKISLGMKQLQSEPWEAVPGKYKVGERITGRVVRLMDFGAFVELAPGIEGLIHVSEMSWVKKVRKPSDILKEGDNVEAVILSVQPAERRIGLGLKQTLGDPWADAAQKFPVGSAIEGPVTNLMKFGAFVQMSEGVEGLVHVSEISAEKHIHHPQDVLKVGQVVRALVLAIDPEKRQVKLSMKQMVPTSLKEYLEEHKEGDGVSGRVIEVSGDRATVELGEGIRAVCVLEKSAAVEEKASGGADLSALTSMLQARWKGKTVAKAAAEPVGVGQIRSFRITKIDREAERIEVAMG